MVEPIDESFLLSQLALVLIVLPDKSSLPIVKTAILIQQNNISFELLEGLEYPLQHHPS